MRVELRVERDEHEYAVTVECDQTVSPIRAITLAENTMVGLMNPSLEEVLHP